MKTAQSRRMDIIVNKQFEVKPFLDALDEHDFNVPDPEESHTPPKEVNRMSQFRRRYVLGHWEVIIRCIEDMLPPNDPDIVETSGSHSQMKAMLLPGYIRKDKPEVILSVSTAESTPRLEVGGASQNGCVVLGCAYYMYDARALDPTSPSRLDVKRSFFVSKPPKDVWDILFYSSQVAPNRFLPAPNAPADALRVIPDEDAMAVGILNVVNYQVYAKADPEAYNAAQKEFGKVKLPATLETTHGIVASSAGTIPTIFVSPITDRYTKFNEDVKGKQNYVAAYNAGVTVAAFLSRLGRMGQGEDPATAEA